MKVKAKKKMKYIKKHIEWTTELIRPDNSSDSNESDGNKDGFTLAERRFMWRHMASYFPLKWCQNFQRTHFNRYRIENQGSMSSGSDGGYRVDNSTPYAPVESCQGPVRNMVCLSTTRNDDASHRMREERMHRNQLCENCYWFMSAINAIMERGEPSRLESNRSVSSSDSGGGVIDRDFKTFLKQLPDSYEIFSHEKKPKLIWPRLMMIHRNLESLRGLAGGLVDKLCSSETSNEAKAKLYLSFAKEFTIKQLQIFKRAPFAALKSQGANVEESAQS